MLISAGIFESFDDVSSSNHCNFKYLKKTLIFRDCAEALNVSFLDYFRYEHVRLKISLWQRQSERRSQKVTTANTPDLIDSSYEGTNIMDYACHRNRLRVLTASELNVLPGASPDSMIISTLSKEFDCNGVYLIDLTVGGNGWMTMLAMWKAGAGLGGLSSSLSHMHHHDWL
ncbi:hypothetical protein Tco_0059256 [Tanacetum coccineum]